MEGYRWRSTVRRNLDQRVLVATKINVRMAIVKVSHKVQEIVGLGGRFLVWVWERDNMVSCPLSSLYWSSEHKQ